MGGEGGERSTGFNVSTFHGSLWCAIVSHGLVDSAAWQPWSSMEYHGNSSWCSMNAHKRRQFYLHEAPWSAMRTPTKNFPWCTTEFISYHVESKEKCCFMGLTREFTLLLVPSIWIVTKIPQRVPGKLEIMRHHATLWCPAVLMFI